MLIGTLIVVTKTFDSDTYTQSATEKNEITDIVMIFFFIPKYKKTPVIKRFEVFKDNLMKIERVVNYLVVLMKLWQDRVQSYITIGLFWASSAD
jgi:hypothetical protein